MYKMCLWHAEWRKNGRVCVNAFLLWKKITFARDLLGDFTCFLLVRRAKFAQDKRRIIIISNHVFRLLRWLYKRSDWNCGW